MNINHYYWDDAQTIQKYQREEPTELKVEVLPRMQRQPISDFTVFDLQWNIKDDYTGTASEEAVKLMHIDGRAGTGKTHLLNLSELDRRGIKYAGFSPTNKGARLIGGNTIHSIFFKF